MIYAFINRYYILDPRSVATSSISAAAIANLVTGIYFPKNKDSLKIMQRRKYLKLIQAI
jgi:hypothetical protein